MLAELHGKLDPERGGPVERSEDLLTDAVFGSIRHLPRIEILGRVLQSVGLDVSAKDLSTAEIRLWPSIPMPRWPGTIIEPDVLVIAGSHSVVFEAKLHSPFGLYTTDDGPALHQLAVQYAAVRSWAQGERLLPPVVVAVTASTQRPETDLKKAAADVQRLVRDSDIPEFRWLSWRSLGEVFTGATGLRRHEKQLVDDVLAFMDKRGVRRMFNGFRPEDYWLVSAAQRVAGDRLYPEVQTFIEDLAAVVAEDGVAWSQPSYKSMWLMLGSSAAKPNDWTRSWIGAQFWPADWPQREGRVGANLALYALFDFLEPALEVGLSVPGPGVAQAQKTWSPHMEQVAQELRSLETEFEIALDAGDVARPSKVINAGVTDAAWLGSAAAAAVGTAHLRLRLRTDPLNLTVQDARERLDRVRSAVDRCPALWTMLRGSGHIA